MKVERLNGKGEENWGKKEKGGKEMIRKIGGRKKECPISGYPLGLQMLENEPFQNLAGNDRFFSCFGWKSWNFICGPYNN